MSRLSGCTFTSQSDGGTSRSRTSRLGRVVSLSAVSSRRKSELSVSCVFTGCSRN